LQAAMDDAYYCDPLQRFLFHHCWCLRDILLNRRFVIERVMPNKDILLQASDYHRQRFELLYCEYERWNRSVIHEMGEIAGFNRSEMVVNYLRGTMINCDDANKGSEDVQMYCQISYALTHLMGHSDKRIPTQMDFAAWLLELRGAIAV